MMSDICGECKYWTKVPFTSREVVIYGGLFVGYTKIKPFTYTKNLCVAEPEKRPRNSSDLACRFFVARQ